VENLWFLQLILNPSLKSDRRIIQRKSQCIYMYHPHGLMVKQKQKQQPIPDPSTAQSRRPKAAKIRLQTMSIWQQFAH